MICALGLWKGRWSFKQELLSMRLLPPSSPLDSLLGVLRRLRRRSILQLRLGNFFLLFKFAIDEGISMRSDIFVCPRLLDNTRMRKECIDILVTSKLTTCLRSTCAFSASWGAYRTTVEGQMEQHKDSILVGVKPPLLRAYIIRLFSRHFNGLAFQALHT